MNGSLIFEEEVDEGERIGGSLEDVGDEMKGIDTILYTFLCNTILRESIEYVDLRS